MLYRLDVPMRGNYTQYMSVKDHFTHNYIVRGLTSILAGKNHSVEYTLNLTQDAEKIRWLLFDAIKKELR
jgi:hypothetical protein